MKEFNCPHCGQSIDDPDLAEYKSERDLSERFNYEFSHLIWWREFLRKAFIWGFLSLFFLDLVVKSLSGNIYYKIVFVGYSVITALLFLCVDLYAENKKEGLRRIFE